MAKGNDLKALQQKQKDLSNQKLELLRKQVELQTQINTVSNKERQIEKQISELTKDFTVSEHALIRYCEKKYNINLNEISKEILDSESLHKYNTLGNGEYPLKDGLKMIVKDKIIVTIK